MRRLFLVVLIGFVTAMAWASPMRPPRNIIMICGGSTGTPPCANFATQFDCSGTASADTRFVETSGSNTVWCEADVAAVGTAPTLTVEGSINDGVSWLPIPTAVTPANTNTRIPSTTAPIAQPIGRYRVKVTACGTAAFTVYCAEERAVGQSW